MNGVNIMVAEGIRFITKEPGSGWVTVQLNKQALDYFREGIANKAASLEREMVREGESVKEGLDFANKLKDEINKLREELTS